MDEIWKSIKNHSKYEVSNKGRIRSSFDVRIKESQIMHQAKNWAGYLRVSICSDSLIRKSFRVHRLVLDAFVGSCPESFICNHKDGNKANNDLSNLEWVSKSDDINHAYHTGLRIANLTGEKHSRTRFKNNDVRIIKKLIAQKVKIKDIAKRFEVSTGCIYHIADGTSWSHI